MTDFEDDNLIANDDGDMSDLSYLKSDNPWLAPFNLTDKEFTEVIRLMTRVIIGSDQLMGFRDRLADALKKDDEFINDLTVAILTNRFLELKPYIKDFDEFVKSLGLTGFSALVEKKMESKSATASVPKAEELKQKLSRIDWQNIQGLERRALLEELGVSSAEFKNWQAKNYLK